MRRKKTTVHSKIEKNPLPLPISERHNNLYLYMYISYINGLILSHSKIGEINLPLVKSLTSRGETSFIKASEEIQNMTQEVSR